jgi:hypothetical protein
MEERRNTYRNSVEKSEESTTWLNLDIDGKAPTGLIWLGIGTCGGH